jgi:hypothetical protein
LSWKREEEEWEEDKDAEKNDQPLSYDAIFPLNQPHYISKRHYEFLKAYFDIPSQNKPNWLRVCVHIAVYVLLLFRFSLLV